MTCCDCKKCDTTGTVGSTGWIDGGEDQWELRTPGDPSQGYKAKRRTGEHSWAYKNITWSPSELIDAGNSLWSAISFSVSTPSNADLTDVGDYVGVFFGPVDSSYYCVRRRKTGSSTFVVDGGYCDEFGNMTGSVKTFDARYGYTSNVGSFFPPSITSVVDTGNPLGASVTAIYSGSGNYRLARSYYGGVSTATQPLVLSYTEGGSSIYSTFNDALFARARLIFEHDVEIAANLRFGLVAKGTMPAPSATADCQNVKAVTCSTENGWFEAVDQTETVNVFEWYDGGTVSVTSHLGNVVNVTPNTFSSYSMKKLSNRNIPMVVDAGLGDGTGIVAMREWEFAVLAARLPVPVSGCTQSWIYAQVQNKRAGDSTTYTASTKTLNNDGTIQSSSIFQIPSDTVGTTYSNAVWVGNAYPKQDLLTWLF
jgi:hypothetical protein